MSLKEKILPVAEIVAAGFLLAVPGIAGVTAYHHRELTHRSLKLHPLLQRFIEWEMRVYSPQAPIWAAVHRLHHAQPDASLKPFLDISRSVEWIRLHPDQAQGVTIPDSYPHLDPHVERFSLADVLEIGKHEEVNMRERMGDSYQPPSCYSREQLNWILNPTESRYFYPENPKRGLDYTQDEVETILGADPHSPGLVPEENGVRGVLKRNVTLYRQASHLFRDHPELMPKDLQTGEVVDHQKVRYRGFIEGSLVAAGLLLLARNKYEPKDFLKALLAGIALNTIKLGFHIAGGNITNSLGHAGVMTPERFIKAVVGKEYKPVLNPDGTVSTDSVNGGLLGRLISTITFDEVGGQKEHHLGPDKIAFTSQKGIKAWIEAPWGMLLDVLARSKYFPLINPGPGFDLKEGEARPDMPNPEMEIIHRRRVEQLGALGGS